MDNTRSQFHTKARLLLNAHMQTKMQQMFGNGYDSGDIEKGFDDPLILKEFKLTGANYKLIFDDLFNRVWGLAGRSLKLGQARVLDQGRIGQFP